MNIKPALHTDGKKSWFEFTPMLAGIKLRYRNEHDKSKRKEWAHIILDHRPYSVCKKCLKKRLFIPITAESTPESLGRSLQEKIVNARVKICYISSSWKSDVLLNRGDLTTQLIYMEEAFKTPISILQKDIFVKTSRKKINMPFSILADRDYTIINLKANAFRCAYKKLKEAFDTANKRSLVKLSRLNREHSDYDVEMRVYKVLDQLKHDPQKVANLVVPYKIATYKKKKEFKSCCYLIKYESDLHSRYTDPNLTFWNVAKDIFTGLKNLHAAGFSHGDIKFENIFVESNRLYLGDYGHAQPLTKLGYCNSGTYGYLSPEVVCSIITKSCEPVHDFEKVDVFAFGVVLYGFLERSLPLFSEYQNNFPMAKNILLLQRSVEEIYRRSSLAEPQNLANRLIWGCLQPDPNKRWSLKQIEDLLRTATYTDDRFL